MNNVSGKFGALIATVIAMSIPTIGSANEIALTLTGQDFTITGQFQDFVDNSYLIQTEYGTITVPADMVTCEGPDCIEVVATNTVSG